MIDCSITSRIEGFTTQNVHAIRTIASYLEGVVLVQVRHLQRAEEGVEPRVGELEGLDFQGRLGREAVEGWGRGRRAIDGVSICICV